MTGSNEYKLNQGPEDSISAVKFSPSTAQFLLVSSWDCTVRLYDVVTNTMRMKYQHTAPVLDCAFYVSPKFKCVTVFLCRKKNKAAGYREVTLFTFCICRTQHILGAGV